MSTKKRSITGKKFSSPGRQRDPTLPASVPATSRDQKPQVDHTEPEIPCSTKCLTFLYDKQNKTYCGRTCKSWVCILAYSVLYLIFLSTFSLVFLFGSLKIMKVTRHYETIDKQELLTYGGNGVGLTATPTSETKYPLIWYRKNKEDDYTRYVRAIDKLLHSYRRKRNVNNLGPCGQSPYGYGDSPCVLVRINKQLKWAGKPLGLNSTKTKSAPPQIQDWMRQGSKKLWLLCDGSNSYDKEHIGRIKYYPDEPGFDPDLYPMNINETSPLVAVQLTNFTLGISLAVECKLWYEEGPSSVEFVVYVEDGLKMTRNSV